MTSFEKSQPPRVFIHAGKLGYMIGVHVLDNPYHQEPYHNLWEKGWRSAQRQYNQKRQQNRPRRPAQPSVRIPAGSRFEMQTVR